MMKFVRSAITLVLGLALLSSCSYNHLDEPGFDQGVQIPKDVRTISITELKALYRGGATTVPPSTYIRARVISSDKEGNFYKTMQVQDAEAGIELKLGAGSLSAVYPLGSEVLVNCSGWVLGRYGGSINLGYASADSKYETSFVPELIVRNNVYSLGMPKEALEPLALTLQDVKADAAHRYANRLVQLSGVQFKTGDAGQKYGDPENKTTIGNVNRTLVDASGNSIIVRSSSYAAFAGKLTPEGSGTVVGILTYFNTTPQLLLNSANDVVLDAPRF